MGHKALIAILALIPTLLFGQPMSISELAWPQVTSTNAPIICGVAATNSFVAVAENSPVHFTLQGLGGTFAIGSGPSSGALSGLDTSSGAVTYTPNLNFIGSDQFTFSVSSNSCITNATVYLATYDTNSSDQTCVTVVGVSTISASGSNCFTVYTNGVEQGSGCDDAFSDIGGSDGFSGIICVGRSCSSITGTNTFLFSITSTNYDNFTYAHWTICNPDNFTRTYKTFGVYSYTNTPSLSFVAMQIVTNGLFSGNYNTVGSIDKSYSIDPTSATSLVYSNGFTVPGHAQNLIVDFRITLTKPPNDTNPPPSFSGSFTNSFN